MALQDAPVPVTETRKPLGARVRHLLLSQEGVLFIILVVSVLFLAARTDKFLQASNLLTQGRLMVEVGLVALPMTFIIITGGIDLSVGSILGLTAIMLGVFWNNVGLPLELSVVLALGVATLAGFLNGLFIVRVGVPPLIMTLATLAFYRGLAEGISEGRSVRGYPEWFYRVGQGDFLGLPTQIWFLIIGIIISAVILSRTTFGRTLYAIGNNEVGARFSGLRVDRAKLLIYSFSGLMSGLAGWIFVSRVTTTRSDMGVGWNWMSSRRWC